jgi:FtsP/CotA-like multicopper oxidase with cupredoxin domain
VKKIGNNAAVRILAYDGSIPGPTLQMKQRSELVVNVANAGDLEANVHWNTTRAG